MDRTSLVNKLLQLLWLELSTRMSGMPALLMLTRGLGGRIAPGGKFLADLSRHIGGLVLYLHRRMWGTRGRWSTSCQRPCWLRLVMKPIWTRLRRSDADIRRMRSALDVLQRVMLVECRNT